MKTLLGVLALILVVGCETVFPQSTQDEALLKQYFEGKRVTLKIDMPATKNGVNVYPERDRPLDFSDYASLKRFGTAIRTGESAMVTNVKVKGKHIEFQLDGGGYGTFSDDTDTDVDVPSTGKSRREKRLEEEVKQESDERRKRRLKEDLDDLRREREREDRRNRAIAADAREMKRARIEQKALQGGSRFNLHYESRATLALTPGALIRALAEYLDFPKSTGNNSDPK